MIETSIPDDYVMSLPLREAMTLLATLTWLMRIAENPSFRLEQAWDVTLGDAIAAVSAAEAPQA